MDIDKSKMKFRAHDTFYVRKGWLSKGLKNVNQNGEVFISKEVNPMDVLGLGSNMVKALRYWLQATGLTEEPNYGKRVQSLTTMGQIIYANDKYLEETGTLLLLQYKLASNYENATSFYFFFNDFNMSEFSRDDFVIQLQNHIKINSSDDVAIRSLNDDFTCIMNTYIPKYKSSPTRVSPENNIECPLSELGLIEILNRSKKTFRKATPTADILNPWIVLAVIVDQAKGQREISLNELLNAPCNIGKVFNMDSITMLDALYRIEKMGEIKINRTAGLDVINILSSRDFNSCVESYYSSLIIGE